MKRLIILGTLLLVGCGKATPESTAKQYLKAAQAGDVSAIKDLTCADPFHLPQIQRWEVTGIREVATNNNPDFAHSVATAQIQSTTGNAQWELEIWDSNRIYERYVEITEKVNQQSQRVNALTGGNIPPVDLPAREEYPEEPYCVLGMEQL